jgi:phage tail-like protein
MAAPKPKYQAKLRFRVKVGGEVVARFRSFSEVSQEFEHIEEHEMGDPDTADLQLGKRKVTDPTLSGGASDNRYLWDWWKACGDPETGEQRPENEIKRKVEVEELDTNLSTVLRKWVYPRALPKKFVAGEFDASASENAVRSMTLGDTKLLDA